jgi:guanine deaminase
VTVPTDETWLGEAVGLAQQNVAEGGGPFGAVIVEGDRVIARGQNRVTRDLDPTAHAEVTAIRAACRERGDLEFYELFARDPGTWPMRVEALGGRLELDPRAPFDAWLARTDRVHY